MSILEKKLISLNIFSSLLLAIYSYSYVDLNLTLSTNAHVLNFVSFMQKLGYYNRPLSTTVFVVLLIVTFSIYFLNIKLFIRRKLSKKYLLTSLVTSSLILVFAYPFLSSDIFNYMFDAKMIVLYHVSPYTHKALDFPNDDWIRFMRWVHRYSPYGPFWLLASTVPFMLGFGKFLSSLFIFKLFIGAFHLLNSYIIYKIVERIKPELKLTSTAFYALNPLFLIEGIINAHNDVVILTFILLTFYCIVKNKKYLSIFSAVVGALIKYITILLVPWILLFHLKKLSLNQLILLSLLTLTVFTFIYSTFGISVPFVSSTGIQIQFQPWYLFWTIPLIAILGIQEIIIPAGLFCFFALLRYLPFLYYGDWTHPNTILFMELTIAIPLLMLIPLSLVIQRSK